MSTPSPFARALRPALVLAVGLQVGCEAGVVDDDDLFYAGEIWDEGPTPEDAHSDRDQSVPDLPGLVAGVPNFQLPFRCAESWLGSTRTDHSPAPSVDFNRTGDVGRPILAAASGVVSEVQDEGNTSYGKWVEVSHGNGWTTRYAHMSRQLVRRGQEVSQGTPVGLLGNTGGSSGPHLHYEQRRNGNAVPASFNGVPAMYWGTRSYRSHNCGQGDIPPIPEEPTPDPSHGDPQYNPPLHWNEAIGGFPGEVTTFVADDVLAVHAGASAGSATVGYVGDGTYVVIECQKNGDSFAGVYGTSTLWDYIGTGYVPDSMIYTGSDRRVAPACD